MAHPLDGTWEKLRRAREHVDVFNEEIRTWLGNNPGEVRCDPGGQALEHTWSLYFPARPPKVRWGVLIGDVLHDVRSALDHLAWQLALLNGPPPEHTAFPIFRDPCLYAETTRKGKPTRRSGLRKVEGLAPFAQAAVEVCQPYRDPIEPDKNPLWTLHVLNNADKHRVVQPMLMQTNQLAVPFRPLTPAPANSISVALNHDPLEDEPAFARITSTDAVLEAGDDYDVTVEPMIDVGDVARINASALMGLIVNYVDPMLGEFDRAFFARE